MKIKIFLAMAAILAGFAGAEMANAQADEFSGLYRPRGELAPPWDCKNIGQPGGAVAVDGGTLFGVENTCTLSNPVQVRDMPAMLFDAECAGEGEVSRRRVMLMHADFGLYLITSGFVAEWQRCE